MTDPLGPGFWGRLALTLAPPVIKKVVTARVTTFRPEARRYGRHLELLLKVEVEGRFEEMQISKVYVGRDGTSTAAFELFEEDLIDRSGDGPQPYVLPRNVAPGGHETFWVRLGDLQTRLAEEDGLVRYQKMRLAIRDLARRNDHEAGETFYLRPHSDGAPGR